MIGNADLISEFSARVIEENPAHENFFNSTLAKISVEMKKELSGYIEYCLSRNLSMIYLVDCYNTITVDTQMEQIFFRLNGRYRHSTFNEVADRVYFDSEYMKKYMYGLAITAFLWPNHAAIHQFFIDTFPKSVPGQYLEVGPGHGYYFRQAALLGNFSRMIGIDISPASVELCLDIMRHYGVDTIANVKVEQADFLNYAEDDGGFSCIVMGEVLEHVEQPGRFLRKISELATPATHIYITTCLDAPAIDHIYLFRTPGEVEALALENGLGVSERCIVPYAGKSLAECEARRLAVNVAYVLKKL